MVIVELQRFLYGNVAPAAPDDSYISVGRLVEGPVELTSVFARACDAKALTQLGRKLSPGMGMAGNLSFNHFTDRIISEKRG